MRATVGALFFACSGPVAVLSLPVKLYLLLAHARGWPLHLIPVVTADAGDDALAMAQYPQLPLAMVVEPLLVLVVYLTAMARRLHRVRAVWPALGFAAGLLAPGLLGALAGLLARLLGS
jgi:hypothetical protein